MELERSRVLIEGPVNLVDDIVASASGNSDVKVFKLPVAQGEHSSSVLTVELAEGLNGVLSSLPEQTVFEGLQTIYYNKELKDKALQLWLDYVDGLTPKQKMVIAHTFTKISQNLCYNPNAQFHGKKITLEDVRTAFKENQLGWQMGLGPKRIDFGRIAFGDPLK